nr:C-type lectin domain family 10 member A-like isoform X2 [Crassostrea gigas]
MRNRYIGVTLLAALSFTACQHLYSREMADDHDEVLRIQYEIKQLRGELVAIKARFPKQHSCPPHWTSFETSCYLVLKEKKMHEDAAMHCIRYGSKLVEIETAEENVFLRNNLLGSSDDNAQNGDQYRLPCCYMP